MVGYKRWFAHVGIAAFLSLSPLWGQELFVEGMFIPGGRHDLEAFGFAVNPWGEGLLVGRYNYSAPLVMAVSENGEPRWALTMEGMGSLQRALPAPQGSVVAGNSKLDAAPAALFAKLDFWGNFLWQRFIPGADAPVRLAAAPENGYYFTAARAYFSDLLPGAVVGRLDQEGEPLWLRVLDMPSLQVNDICSGADGTFLLVGSVFEENRKSFGFVSSWSAQGQPQWAARLKEGTTLETCAFGGPGWLVAGNKGASVWLATLDGAANVLRQMFVESGSGSFRPTEAIAAEGWLLAAEEETAYGRAYLLRLPWDLATVSHVGVRRNYLMNSAGVAALPDGRVLLAGTETTHSGHVSNPFLVSYRGEIGDFWECPYLVREGLRLPGAAEVLQPLVLTLSPQIPSLESLPISLSFLEPPQRAFYCVDRNTPVADLEIAGDAQVREDLGERLVLVHLRIRNRGAALAEGVVLRLWAGIGASIVATPSGYNCKISAASSFPNDCFCTLGDLSAGADLALSFTLRGTPFQLHQGYAMVGTPSVEETRKNNWLELTSILPRTPRVVLRGRR